jgi:hypothetical protein
MLIRQGVDEVILTEKDLDAMEEKYATRALVIEWKDRTLRAALVTQEEMEADLAENKADRSADQIH